MSPGVIAYLDPAVAPIELESKIEFDEVYALNENGSRSFKQCVTLEDFYAFLAKERRHLKGERTACEVKIL